MRLDKIIFIILIIFSYSLIFSQEKINVRGKSKVIESEGNFKAREKAISNAYKSGVEKIILKIIPEQSYKDNKAKFDEEILSNSKAFIKEEEIIDEDVNSGEYVINIDLVIDKKKLSDAVSSVSNSSVGNLTDMTLAVAIDEIVIDQNGRQIEVRTGNNSNIGAKIEELLKKNNISVQQADVVENIRKELVGKGKNLSQLLLGNKSDDNTVQLAGRMLSEFKIDAIVLGTTKIVYTGKDKDGFNVATASSNIRVIETSTARVLAAGVSNETGIAKSDEAAATAAARRLGNVLGEKLVTQLQQKWLELVNNGIDYEIRFNGANENTQKGLLDILKEIDGMTKVTVDDKNDSTLTVKVFFKGKPSKLTDQIFKKAFSIPELSGISEELVLGNSLRYKMNSPIKKRDIAKEIPVVTSFTKPTIYAVVIGVSQYADESMNLGSATADAELLKQYFLAPDGLNIPKANLKFIADKEATRQNVIKGINETFSKSNPNDLIILYFAGHGYAEDKEMYFLSHDANKDDIKNTAISQIDIKNALLQANATKQIFIADACHSGAVSLGYMSVAANSEESLPNSSRNVDTRYTLTKSLFSSSSGLSVMTAASANQLSQEGPQWGGGHGIFTWTLLQGLKGEADYNKDKLITINEAYIYTILKMSQETSGKQTPSFQGPVDLPLGVLK